MTKKQRLNYFIERGIPSEAIMTKSNDEGCNLKDYKYYFSKIIKNHEYFTLSDFLEFFDVLLVYRDIVYVSKEITIPKGIMKSKLLKKQLSSFFRNESSLLNFLRSGIIILDIRSFRNEENYIPGYNPTQNFIIFTDAKEHFTPVKDIIFLDEFPDISDDLFIEFYGEDVYEEAYNAQKDEEYLDLLEEYEEMYEK